MTDLPFKDGNAAVEYAGKFMDCSVEKGRMLPAVVVDASQQFGTKEAVSRNDDGTQTAILRVASEDGGFLVAAQTAGAHGPTLEPGTLVAWQALDYKRDLGEKSNDRRFGWLGLIVARLKPEYRNGSWVGDQRFT